MARKSGLSLSLMTVAMLTAAPSAAQPTKDIVVFDFQMMDSSAAAGIIPPDDLDAKYLAEATEVAKSYLQAQGAYTIVDAKPASADVAKAGTLLNCNGCEAKIASKLGGELAMTGIVNRISRTEYEILIRVVDAGTGARVAAGYTGLRMGANHSWPRGAKWLMERRVMADLSGQ
jgi:hypothetical protein